MKKLLIAGALLSSVGAMAAEPSWVTDIRNGGSLEYKYSSRETYFRNIHSGSCDEAIEANHDNLKRKYPFMSHIPFTVKVAVKTDTYGECATTISVDNSTLKRLDNIVLERKKRMAERIEKRRKFLEELKRQEELAREEEDNKPSFFETLDFSPNTVKGAVLETGTIGGGFDAVGLDMVGIDYENWNLSIGMTVAKSDTDEKHYGMYMGAGRKIGHFGSTTFSLGGNIGWIPSCDEGYSYWDDNKVPCDESKRGGFGVIELNGYQKIGKFLLKGGIDHKGDVRFGVGFSW